LRGAFQFVGTVISFVFGGAILKAISLLGKFGGVFSVVGEVARVASVPFRVFGGLVKGGIGIAVRAVVGSP
jgi:hypothetical protein